MTNNSSQQIIPHTFPTLTNPNAVKSALLIGAGMSNGMAPAVSVLTSEICANHDNILQKLGISISPPEGNSFYDWAENAFDELKNVRHLSDGDAKLFLANAMGITSDPRFQAKVGMPLRGNTPRHRVVARFAREGRWSTICSLNWDCILETALESVGLLPRPDARNHLANPLPWHRWYCTWQAGDQHVPSAMANCTVHLIKPHGCVNKLATGDASSFIVTKSEIIDLPNQLGAVVSGRMNLMFSDVSLVTLGWSAAEDYIHNNIENIKSQGTLLQGGADRLSVINRSWYPDGPTGLPQKHDRLAAAFEVDRSASFFSAGKPGYPTVDELFQWLQTRYGLERMHEFAQAKGMVSQAQELKNVIKFFSKPDPANWLNGLFDNFLSVWVRLCFNSSCVIYKCHAAPIPTNLVATHRRDEHIPWRYGETDRNDLLAAIPLVLTLWNKQNCPWSFSEYPGALWNVIEGHLVLPLPAWGPHDKPIELAALKPLMDGWSWSNKGAIKKLSVLLLMPESSFSTLSDNNVVLRSSVAWSAKASQFADPKKIGVIGLSDL